VDVRIITATNQKLEEMIENNMFREDLYFRINVFPLHTPALRERHEDIPMIVQNFIRQNNAKTGKKILGLTPEAMEKFSSYDWPGNVRELRNAVEYAFVLCPSGGINVHHLPPKIVSTVDNICGPPSTPVTNTDKKEHLIQVLRETRGNQSEAARRLNVSRVTVWKRIKKYGIDLKKVLAQ
jgi:transcriptional regulator with PAS, ATPase and Fis domain